MYNSGSNPNTDTDRGTALDATSLFQKSWQTLRRLDRLAHLKLTQCLEQMPSCFIPISSCQSHALISLLLPSGALLMLETTIAVIFLSNALKILYIMNRQGKKLISSRDNMNMPWFLQSSCPIITHNAETITFTIHSQIRWIPFSWLRQGINNIMKQS